MSLIRLALAGQPTCSGTMWVTLGISGRPAAVNFVLSIAAESYWARRSSSETFKWRTLGRAAALVGGDLQGGADGQGPGNEYGRNRAREDEAWRVAADTGENPPVGCDI